MPSQVRAKDRDWAQGQYYVEIHPESAGPQVCWIKLDGTERTIVIPDKEAAFDPELSSDGAQLVFAKADNKPNGKAELFVSRPDGSEAQQLTHSEAHVRCFAPAWSPDGQTIAYSRWKLDAGGQSASQLPAVWLYDVNSREAKRLTEGICPAWHPNGKSLLVTRLEPGMIAEGSLWSVPLRGGARKRFYAGRTAMSARWSDDGSQVCCSVLGETLEAELALLNADGKELKRLPLPNYGQEPESEWIWARAADNEPRFIGPGKIVFARWEDQMPFAPPLKAKLMVWDVNTNSASELRAGGPPSVIGGGSWTSLFLPTISPR